MTMFCDEEWDAFSDDILPGLFQLVDDAWREIVPVVESDPSQRTDEKKKHEDRISRRLVASMRKKARHLPLIIDRMDRIDSQQELLGDDAEVIGRIDVFIARHAPDAACFIFEAKRLNHCSAQGKWSSEAGPYVRDGMSRFISQQYAKGQGKGGMLGYVLDGDVNKAKQAVEKTIDEERAGLRLLDEDVLKPSSILPGKNHVRESHHDMVPSRRFVIHHLFLANRVSKESDRN